MSEIVDLHIHSHYSRATSKHTTLEWLYYWGKIKGIHVIGSGDITHPKWRAEVREKLVMQENGYYVLRQDIADQIDATLPPSVRDSALKFVLTCEISTIYKKKGSVRKLHNCVVLPTLTIADNFAAKLEKIGNLKADGRPILGLDSKILLQMTLESHPDSLFFPAHIWTPWFGMFGSKSGFDSILDTFDDLSDEVKVIETGLSADPYMCCMVEELRTRTIISNSDAHSPQKLGREATMMKNICTYKDLIDGLKSNDQRIEGTIEFFPQEGKYYQDGHRACDVNWTPAETKSHNEKCPVCHTPVTVGVANRVEKIATHKKPSVPLHDKRVEYIIPLIEIEAQLQHKNTTAKSVQSQYHNYINALGNEFDILRNCPISTIEASGNNDLAKAVRLLRAQKIIPGYDGEFGMIRLNLVDHIDTTTQKGLFS